MKLLYSLGLLFFSLKSYGSQIFIYYATEMQKDTAMAVQSIFLNDYLIPESLIHLKLADCKSLDQRFLEICINEENEIEKLDNKKQEEIKRSLLIFSQNVEVFDAN